MVEEKNIYVFLLKSNCFYSDVKNFAKIKADVQTDSCMSDKFLNITKIQWNLS